MGDSRISVTILLDVETPHKTVVSMPADSPLSELVAHVKDELKLLGTTGMCSTHQASIHTQHTDCEGDSDTRFTCTFGPDNDNDNDNVSNLLAMYDCTLHPPKDVTSQVIQYDQPMGPNSITLQSLQWFPSAKLFIILRGDEGAMKKILESDIYVHEDFQYNLPTSLNVNDKNDNDNDALAPNTKNSRLIGGQKLLPSEMFQAVENRFDDETMMNADIDDVKKPRKIQKKRRTEKERWALLDDRLKKLDEKTNSNSNSNSSNRKKSAKVSAQVKKMLIKSRAEGDKKTIRQEDRFYLETIVMYANHNPDDDSGDDESSSSSLTSSYRFFSRSSNVGKIISSVTRGLSLGKNQLVEVLVKTIDTGLGMDTDADAAMGIINMDKKDSGDFCYRRLPNTMMIYDAESRSYLSNFDRVIIRIYDSHADGSENTTTTTTTTTCTPLIGSSSTTTTLLSEEKDIPRSCMDQDDEIMTDDTDQAGTRIDSHPNSHVEREIYEKIHRAIEEMDSKDNKTNKKKKKKTAATEKVRQILLKGKAKGDKKIPVKDRFYLEVISITLSFESQSTNVFLSKYDSMRAVSMSVSHVDAFEILKSQTNNDDDDDDSKNFTKIQDDLRIKDAEDRGIIQQFDRIIVREITNTSSKES